MASDYLLEIPGIPGESKDAEFPEAIEVFSWSIGASNAGSFGGGTRGGGVGKAQFQDLAFTTTVNKATVKLLQAIAHGQHFTEEIKLHCRKAGGGQKEFLTYKLKDSYITSQQVGGSNGSGGPTESFSINYKDITMIYKPQKEDGELDAAIEFQYDIEAQT